jgi:hypothetical protein
LGQIWSQGAENSLRRRLPLVMKVPPTTRLLSTDDGPHGATIPVKQVEQDAVHGYSEVIDLHFVEVVGDLVVAAKENLAVELRHTACSKLVTSYCISEIKALFISCYLIWFIFVTPPSEL